MTPQTFLGKIVDFKPDGTFTIVGRVDDLDRMLRFEPQDAWVQLRDSRAATLKQKALTHALVNEIGEDSGYIGKKQVQEMLYPQLKAEFVRRSASLNKGQFQLRTADVSTAGEFIDFLISFMIENGIPSNYPLYEHVSNVEQYVYNCFINRKCCLCGKEADLHHVDRIGMGADRHEAAQVGMHVMTLCREHHNLIHSIGEGEFFKRYKIRSIKLTEEMERKTKSVYHFTDANMRQAEHLNNNKED